MLWVPRTNPHGPLHDQGFKKRRRWKKKWMSPACCTIDELTPNWLIGLVMCARRAIGKPMQLQHIPESYDMRGCKDIALVSSK
ncbi:unnamed protein product [Penicillium roqueforti FM164]|uniref:Genomic scaffold, ProqFM164S04 n=1 Tax=Penicillium roqueforti (strain FM164) TaxID=1365484 RepID=W6QGX7_PENRF|nr:unnamed protein product [Penicillium roqueforti FM164]